MALERELPRHDPGDVFAVFDLVRPSRAALIDRWTRNFTHQHLPKSNPPRELKIDMLLSPEQARRGGTIPIDVPVANVCPRCAGTGLTGLFTCDLCDGQGMEWETARVDVLLSPPVRDGTVINIPLGGLGVENFYLRVRTRVADLA